MMRLTPSRRFYFPLQKTFLAALFKLGYRVELDAPAKATVIILSYKRMQNIPVIVRSALLCAFAERVLVCNNNPDVDLSPYLPMRDSRFELIQQSKRRWPSYRYDLARKYPSDYYICIDDDVFPTPWQLRQMFTAILDDPGSPVGSAGQIWDSGAEKLSNVFTPNENRPVDILLQIYVFTKKHLEKYFGLVEALGLENGDVHSSEDVIISFAGDKRPRVEHVGHVFDCATSDDPAVATYQQAGFLAFRHDLYRRLTEAGPTLDPSNR